MKYTDDFLKFYDTYPRHEGKLEGQKAWLKLTPDQRLAAQVDVEKRKRAGAYSANKKLIQLPASYLNAHRWEDDWELTLKSSKTDPDAPNNPFIPPVRIPEVKISWEEQMINRLFKSYVFTAMGLPEVATALKIKSELLDQVAPALAEDIENGWETREGASKTLANTFMDRMDLAYGLTLKPRALKFAKDWRHGITESRHH